MKRGLRALFNLRERFCEIDSDMSGALSFEEFSSSIRAMRLELPEIDIKNAFKAFDLNNDG